MKSNESFSEIWDFRKISRTADRFAKKPNISSRTLTSLDFLEGTEGRGPTSFVGSHFHFSLNRIHLLAKQPSSNGLIQGNDSESEPYKGRQT